MKNYGERVLSAIGLAVIWIIIGGLITKWLWNWLCPDLFGLPEISFLQAWGLTTLTTILFKSSSK